MATIDDKCIIDQIINGNGFFSSDLRVHMIVEYTNHYGNKTWGVTWSNEPESRKERYLVETPYINRPKIIWIADE